MRLETMLRALELFSYHARRLPGSTVTLTRASYGRMKVSIYLTASDSRILDIPQGAEVQGYKVDDTGRRFEGARWEDGDVHVQVYSDGASFQADKGAA